MNDNNLKITWNSKFASGIRLIDEQHKGLVDLVNEMSSHVTGNYVQEHDYFNRAIHDTVKYVRIHFATEEKIMLATRFSGYAAHKKEHDGFIHAIFINVRDYAAGKRFTLLTFSKFLQDWVLSHIALVDRQYFEYLKRIATRKADGRLSIDMADVNNAAS